MKTRFLENNREHLLLILVIGFVLPLGIFVNDVSGIAQITPPPGCSPCDRYDFDIWCSLTFRCMGCIADCGNCYSCDTSIPGHPSCKEKCKYEECKDCNYGSDLCSKCVGCKSTCSEGWTPCPGLYGCDCCDPNQCLTCIGGECKPCNNDPNKACCNGQCYDIRIQQCCQDTANGYICDINQPCCYGNCCEVDQCCDDVNHVCIDPICDNCHEVPETLYECHHWSTDPNGAPCSTVECIENTLDSATCDHKGSGWPCSISRCNTSLDNSLQPEVIQTIHSSSCSGGTVNWTPYHDDFYEGCDTCTSRMVGSKACEEVDCFYNPIPGRGGPRGIKRVCGQCVYP